MKDTIQITNLRRIIKINGEIEELMFDNAVDSVKLSPRGLTYYLTTVTTLQNVIHSKNI